MTQKLTELFNLPVDNDTTVEQAEQSIEENRALIEETDLAIDKIDAALPFVNDLDTSDKELDELSDLAKEKFQDLIDLGMNVEARFSGHILATAGTLLGHAITAKQAKIDRKIRTVDLQLKKMRLDQQALKDAQKTDGDKILDAEDGKGVLLDRNDLLKQILESKPKQ
jgi:type II restriction/modification system DNA methylase subunit YeeA